MRSILGGGAVCAWLWLGAAGFAGESLTSYYAEPAAETQLAPPPDDGSLTGSSCGDCCGCCCECYDCCDSSGGRRRILGLLPSDHCFDSFISPLSNPFFFEDPRSLTEVRGIFLDNGLPNSIGTGDAHVWAAQIRGRVTDRVSVIAPRLAYFKVNQAGGGAPEGFLSAPIGLKYNFLRDVERQLLVSAGITYFIPESLNNFPIPSDGDFHFFLTGGKQIFGYGHWLSATGFRIPTNSNWGTQLWYWSNQWDYEFADRWYGLFGVNWFHWMRSATFPTGLPVTGLDLINLPANGVAGTDVVTGVVGLKFKPCPGCELGTGFEFPLTYREDILRNRVYADLIVRY